MNRRSFLTRVTAITAGFASAKLVGQASPVQADDAVYYVWYRPQGGRWTGEGPFTWYHANIVANERRQQGFSGVYIGGVHG